MDLPSWCCDSTGGGASTERPGFGNAENKKKKVDLRLLGQCARQQSPQYIWTSRRCTVHLLNSLMLPSDSWFHMSHNFVFISHDERHRLTLKARRSLLMCLCNTQFILAFIKSNARQPCSQGSHLFPCGGAKTCNGNSRKRKVEGMQAWSLGKKETNTGRHLPLLETISPLELMQTICIYTVNQAWKRKKFTTTFKKRANFS